jgi:hypothetical protein
MTRTIELPIPDELLRLVDERARAAGLRREAYIRSVLSRDVNAEPSLGDILDGFRDQVAASGASDDELDDIFSEAREEAFRERRQPGADGR